MLQWGAEVGTREIPQSFEHKCDGCGKLEATKSKSRPSYWSNLSLAMDVYDFQGCAVADGSVHRLLCRDCTKVTADAINAAIRARSTQEKSND